jgi:hypothetical protein
MRINWNARAKAPKEVISLLGGSPSRSRRAGLESTYTSPPDPKERIERLSESINFHHKRSKLGAGNVQIAKEITQGAQSALAKLEDPDARFTFRERAGLEAVVLTDGTRPSLNVKNGFVDLDNPDVGDWDAAFKAFRTAMKSVIASVGRVNVPTNVGFAGTCFAIAPDLVVTNRHVVEEIARQGTNGTWALLHPEATFVDFIAESGSRKSRSNRVLSVAFAGPDPINRRVDFAHLDLAVLRLDPGKGLPKAVILEGDRTALRQSREVYLVGFPAQPRTHFGSGKPLPGFETSEVMGAVFNWKFGVKKLAPGKVAKPPGRLTGDKKRWVFSHDASTLGGNSGSAVVDLSIDGARVVGLHFGGLARDENWSHAVSRISELRQATNLTWI